MELERPAKPPSAAESARIKIGELEKRLASMGDRRAVNRKAREEAGLPTNSHDSKALAEWRSEALRLELEDQDLRAWLARAKEDLAEALAREAVEAERNRAELARARFNEFGILAQEFSDRLDDMVRLFGALREAAASVAETGFGPNERQVSRWAQRLIVFKCQHDRNLRFEDPMADGRERQWLASAPRDWLTKLQADTAALIGPAAEAAE